MPSTIRIVPWTDPVLVRTGHDPRSIYVETFWLPTLGPTAVLLLRHLATRFEIDAGGVELPVATTSRALGLGHRDGASSPIVRTLQRLVQFGLACDNEHGTIAVRRHLPPINPRHVRRLPEHLQREHVHWAEQQVDAALASASPTGTPATPPAPAAHAAPRTSPRRSPRPSPRPEPRPSRRPEPSPRTPVPAAAPGTAAGTDPGLVPDHAPG